LDRSAVQRRRGQYDYSPSSFTASLGARRRFRALAPATRRAGGAHGAGAGSILRANSTGCAPTISDLFYPGFSNPDLEPEKSLGWDVGVEQPLLGGRLQVGASWFQNDFDNLIAWSSPTYLEWKHRDMRPRAFVFLAGAVGHLTVDGRRRGSRPPRTAPPAPAHPAPEHNLAVHYRLGGSRHHARIAGSTADNFRCIIRPGTRPTTHTSSGTPASPSPPAAPGLVAGWRITNSAYEEAYGFPALGHVLGRPVVLGAMKIMWLLGNSFELPAARSIVSLPRRDGDGRSVGRPDRLVGSPNTPATSRADGAGWLRHLRADVDVPRALA
jgi:hypothetical protein